MTDDRLATMSREELIAEVVRLLARDELSGGHIRRLHAVGLDNERLRDAQLEMASIAARYQDLFEAAPLATCVLDARGRIQELNGDTCRMLGAPADALRDKPLARFVAAKHRRVFEQHLARTLRGTETTDIVVPLLPRALGAASVKVVCRPLRRGGEEVLGCRVSFFDVTEHRRELEALHVALRMRDDFLAVVAHDLKGPLAVVGMSAELLERHLRPEGAPDLQRIRRAAARMTRLVGDLLDISSMDAGHLAHDPAMHDVADLVVTALEMTGPLAAAKSLSLTSNIPHGAVHAWCDRERVVQVLSNLVGNAVKFTDAGSITVRARTTGNETHVIVHDTGTGMSRPQLEHAFDPYWQGAPRASRTGTGLGLSIVKGIVGMHGGRVWVESRLGRGSTFTFTLPARAPHAGASSASTPPLPARAPQVPVHAHVQPHVQEGAEAEGPLVLLIDDEASVRESVGEALRAEGYRVVAVANGRAALDFLDGAPGVIPNLILLDLVMPVMDGWEFLRQQSRAPRLASVPVVLVSGQGDRAAALQLAGYVPKPVRLAALCEVVSDCVTRAA